MPMCGQPGHISGGLSGSLGVLTVAARGTRSRTRRMALLVRVVSSSPTGGKMPSAFPTILVRILLDWAIALILSSMYESVSSTTRTSGLCRRKDVHLFGV